MKSLKGNRLCEISPQLVEHLRAVRPPRGDRINSVFSSRRKTGRLGIPTWFAKENSIPLLEKLGIPALRVPCFPARQRDGDGSGECADGCTANPPGPLRRTHNHAVLACCFRGRKAIRCATRRPAYEIRNTGDGSRKCVILVSSGAKFEVAGSASDWRGWLRGVDLNHRPLGYEPNELPDCSTPRNHHSNVVIGAVKLRAGCLMVGRTSTFLP